MALKDITLGQYFPGNTLLHRLDPRTKLLGTVAYIVALFLAKGIVGYAVLLAVLAALIAVSRVGLKTILRGMKPILVSSSSPPCSTCSTPPERGSPWPPSGSSRSIRRASGRPFI